MKRTKRLAALLTVVCLLLTMLPAAFAATSGTIVLTIDSPNMSVNGVSKQIDENGTTAVLDKGGYTMLPLRAVVEAMGGSLTWDAANRAITMVKDNQTVKVTVGSKDAYVNGTLKSSALQYAPRITAQGRTLVHIRALELFTGTTCTWNQAAKQVTVNYTMSQPTTPPVTSKNYRIDLINKTGAEIKSLYYGVAGTWQYSQTNALSGNVKNNGTASFYISVPTNATNMVYDFYTEDAANGSTKMYSGLNLHNVNAYATIVLQKDRKFEQANDKSITVTGGDTALKFVNNYSRDIEELYMATSSSGLSDADNLLATETVESKDDTTIDIDLAGTKSWYFKAVDENGKSHTSGKVTFSSATAKSATLTLTSGGDLRLGSGDGDVMLAIINDDSGVDIEEAYLVSSQKDFDGEDRDTDDDFLSGSVDEGEYQVIEGAADNDTYDLILYYGSGDDDWDYIDLDLEDVNYAAVWITGEDDGDLDATVYAEGDDELLVGLANDYGEDMLKTGVYEYDPDESDDAGDTIDSKIGTLKEGGIYFFEVDASDYPDILIDWDDDSDYVENLDDEEAFVLITVDDDGDASMENMDDLA